MMTTRRRAANDLDLRSLTRGRGSLARNLATVSLPAAAIVFGFVYWRWRSLRAAAVTASVLFLLSLLSNVLFFRKVRRRENLKRDENAVETLDVSTSSVLDLEPVGDNAPAFCVFVGDGKALLLAGQWLRDYRAFPCEAFLLHRWADSQEPIRLEVTGKRLQAQSSTVQLRPSHRFRKIEIFEATPETLQEDLDKAFAR